jgi:phosphonate transport system ATP-binding protein
VGVSGGRIVFDGRPDDLTPEVLRRIYPGLDDGAVPGSAGRARPASPHHLTLEEA